MLIYLSLHLCIREKAIAEIHKNINMPRSEEAEAWSNAVYAAIQEVPYGKVTSYGHIALLLGERTEPSPRVEIN